MNGALRADELTRHLSILPKIAWLTCLETLYGGMFGDVIARRNGFKNYDSMYAAWLFAWELHCYLEYVRA